VPRRSPQLLAGIRIASVLGGAVIVAVLLMAVAGMLGTDSTGPQEATARVPTSGQLPSRADTPAAPGQPQIAVVKRRTALRRTPGGRRLATVATKTAWRASNWSQPRVLPVVEQRGDWLRVIATELPNGRSGWIAARDVDVGPNPFAVRVDLSRRQITVTKDGRVVRRMPAAVGEQGTPTPRGTFAVTDRLNFVDQGSVYGCCVLALSAHQPNTAPGWSGDDRIAIHATPDKSSIGRRQTNGCMRVPDPDAAWLMTRVPLGTVVTVTA
jgi:lipoprotein-anchoring transpeptidase ErfK/SrfK